MTSIATIYPDESQCRSAELRLRDQGIPRAYIRLVAPRKARVHRSFKLVSQPRKPPRFLPDPITASLLLGVAGMGTAAAKEDQVIANPSVEATLSVLAGIGVAALAGNLLRRLRNRNRLPRPVISAVRQGAWALVVRVPRGMDRGHIKTILRPGSARILTL